MVAAISHDVASIRDEVTARYLAEMRNQEPEAPRLEAVIEREQGAFVFRTRAGTSESVRITLPVISPKDAANEKYGAKIERAYQRKYGDRMDYFEDLQDRVGSHRIKFQRIGVGKGCVYQTHDPVIADFIRSLIPGGTIDGLYEDYQTSSQLRSKYTDKLFPNTEAGRIQLGAYDLAIEQEATRRLREETALDAATAPPKGKTP